MFIHPFFHLFVCSLLAHATVRANRVHVFKKKKKKKKKKKNRHMQVKWKTKRPCVFLIIIIILSIAKVLLKLSGCTCCSGTLVVICFLGRRPLFHVSLFLL